MKIFPSSNLSCFLSLALIALNEVFPPVAAFVEHSRIRQSHRHNVKPSTFKTSNVILSATSITEFVPEFVPELSLDTTNPLFSSLVLLSENGGGGNFIQNFQDNHTFLEGLLLTIAIKVVVGEIRRKIEKPIMDEAGRRVAEAAKENLTPDTEQITTGDWAKLGGCIAMDFAGDASELIPVLGEFTDVAFAPAEAALLQVLFKSPLISFFGFAEEILPFTDIIPTFTLSWMLSTLFPTTPLAKGLLPAKEKDTKLEQ